MDAVTFSKTALEDPRFLEKSLAEKLNIKASLLANIKESPEFYSMEYEDRKNYEKKYMTAPLPGLDTASLVIGDDEDNRSKVFLDQANSAWETGKADVNFGNGFLESSSDFLTGKVGAAVVDLFTANDTTKYLYGDRSDEYKQYRDYVFDTLNPEGIGDYKAGKVVGFISGFGADAFVASQLYGAVGAPGLITKAFGGFTSNAARSALPTLSRLGAKAPAFIGQMGVETAGYLAETAIADVITGEIDSDTTAQEYLSRLPTELGRGIAYFAMGEVLGKALSVTKGLGGVFTSRGAQEFTFKDLKNMSPTDLAKQMENIAGDDGEGLRALLKSSGYSDADVRKTLEAARDVRIAGDPNLKTEEIERLAYKHFYGMETEKVGDGMKIKSFGGEPLSTPKFVADSNELLAFMKEANLDFKNKQFETSAKIASDRKGTIELGITTVKGETVIDMSPVDLGRIFRPADDKVVVSELQSILDATVRSADIKIQPVSDYFTREIRARGDKNLVYVPTHITSAEQSDMFVKQFFDQVKASGGKNLDINTKQAQALLRGTSNIKYDGNFLTLLKSADEIKVKDGKVSLLQGEEWVTYPDMATAARAAHMEQYADVSLNATLTRDKGLMMRYNEDSIDLLDAVTGKVQGNYKNIEAIYADPTTRPPLPASARPNFRAFKADLTKPLEGGMLATGTVDNVIKQSKLYAKENVGTLDRGASATKKMSYDPKFQQFTVSMKDNGIVKEFSSYRSAKEFMEKDLSSFKELEELAYEKGYRIKAVAGGYEVFTDGSPAIFAKNMGDDKESLAKVIGNLDSLTNVKDTLDSVPLEITEGVTKRFREDYLPMMEKLKAKQEAVAYNYKGDLQNPAHKLFKEFWEPTNKRLADIGDENSIKLFNKAVGSDKAFQATYGDARKRINAMFHGAGRNFSHADLRNMGQVLAAESSPQLWRAKAKEIGFELTDQMEETLQSVRTIFDAFGTRFGIKESEWIPNYQSRIANLSNSQFDAVLNRNVMQEATQIKGSAPVNAFFDNVRIEDYTQARFEDNIESILDTYVRVGLRKEFLGGITDEINEGLASKALNEEAARLLKKTNEQVLGRIYSSERAEEVAKRVRQNKAKADYILDKKGKWSEKTLAQREEAAARMMETNHTAFIQSLMTSSLMAGKMKMPLRNVAQVWNIGSNLAGADYILRGQELVGNKEAAVALYKELHSLGIVKPRTPVKDIDRYAQKFVNTINEVGMNNFYHSDDYTRMVMSSAMRDRFRDAMTLYTKGEVDMAGFMKASKASWFDIEDQKRFIQLMNNKDFASAEALSMRRGTQITMFDYDLTNKPEKLTSGIGKIFGQYGTYPSQYLQFVLKGATQGSKAETTEFLTNLTLTTAAVGLFYNDLLNIKGVAMNPTSVMTFGGSPMFGAITDVAGQIQDGTVDKRVLLQDASLFIPMFGTSRGLAKGVEEIAEGNMVDGLTRFLGATPADKQYVPEFIDNNF